MMPLEDSTTQICTEEEEEEEEERRDEKEERVLTIELVWRGDERGEE